MGLIILDTPEKAKDYIQESAVKLSDKYNSLLLTWATGCGKTLAALKIIRRQIFVLNITTKWYIICEEHNHIDNWKREIALHGFEDILPYIEFFCYASLQK